MGAKVTVKGVELDLDEVFEEIPSKAIVSEVDGRAATGDPDILSALDGWAEEYSGDAGGDDGSPFYGLNAWDMDDLNKAILEDDGRRAIDVLKRALA